MLSAHEGRNRKRSHYLPISFSSVYAESKFSFQEMVAPSAAASLGERESTYEIEEVTKNNKTANRKGPASAKATLRTKHGA